MATVRGLSLEQVRQFGEAIVSDGGVQFVVIDRDTVGLNPASGWKRWRSSPDCEKVAASANA